MPRGVYIRTKKIRKKTSDSISKRYQQDPEYREKTSKAMKGKGHTSWNKGLSADPSKENYDERVAKNVRNRKITMNRPEIKKKMSRILTVVNNRPEVREKNSRANRIAFERRIENSGYPRNYFKPNFNFLTIPIFKTLDKILHTRSRYGGTRAGEKKIGKYFVDCFNKKYQFIIEWNEDWHDSYPKGYDTEKRRYILTKYPDYNYIIIKQSDWFKKGNLIEKITTEIVKYILSQIKGKK